MQDQQEGVQDFRDHIDPDNHGPKVVEYEADSSPSYDRPYLILDVRAPEEFQRCRIMQVQQYVAGVVAVVAADSVTMLLFKLSLVLFSSA